MPQATYKSTRNFLDTELVQKHLAVTARAVAQGAVFRFTRMTELVPAQVDSPLEVIFWIWWKAFECDGDGGLALIPQREVVVAGATYRPDCIVEPRREDWRSSPLWRPIAVEMDGHGFHERTREQVVSRDRRDRDLQSAGWRVFHYSFSEFINHPADCVGEVLDFAGNQLSTLQAAEAQA